jgi:hypothetical protein
VSLIEKRNLLNEFSYVNNRTDKCYFRLWMTYPDMVNHCGSMLAEGDLLDIFSIRQHLLHAASEGFCRTLILCGFKQSNFVVVCTDD